ncbi:hypothetical protein_gp255 [Bacillus phage vB_BceM_WH1]|nr:hypothetical protein_gp255 [Bacillus phage vB_BceM_WH1]
MRKAFAKVKLNGKVVHSEAIVILTRKSGRVIALCYDKGSEFYPLSVQGMLADDNGEVKIHFKSPKYDKLDHNSFRRDYIWREIIDCEYAIEEENNGLAVRAMKGEEVI